MEWSEGHVEGKSRASTSQIQGNQRLQWRAVHGWGTILFAVGMGTLIESILNVRSSFVDSVVQSAQQRPVRADMVIPPTEDEVMRALLKGSKAGGKNGMLPEMLKSCGGLLFVYIMGLFGTVWKEERFPVEWRDALLVPVPKKGRPDTVW